MTARDLDLPPDLRQAFPDHMGVRVEAHGAWAYQHSDCRGGRWFMAPVMTAMSDAAAIRSAVIAYHAPAPDARY